MEKKYKFLMVTAYYPPFGFGGDSNHVKDLAIELVKKGHEVHVIHSLDTYNRLASRWGAKDILNLDKQGVFIHTVQSPLRNFDMYLAYGLGVSPYLNNKFEEVLKYVKPDVVHYHNFSSFGHNQILKKRGDYISIYTAHNYWFICPTERLFRPDGTLCTHKKCISCALLNKKLPQMWRWSNTFKNSINSIDAIIAPSDFMKERLTQELDARIECIPNFIPSPPSTILNSGYSDYFLYTGVLEEVKGIMDLLDVFRLYSSRINAKLIIAGTGNLENKIRKVISSDGLRDNVIFLGWVERERLWPLYKDALALIIPSIWPENCPLTALEAISVGTPVIGSDQGGTPNIVEKIDKGLVFPAGDIEGLAARLAEFDRRKYPAEMLKRIYKDNYSVEAYLERYEKVIDSNVSSI